MLLRERFFVATGEVFFAEGDFLDAIFPRSVNFHSRSMKFHSRRIEKMYSRRNFKYSRRKN